MAAADYGLKFKSTAELERLVGSKACRNRQQLVRELATRRKRDKKNSRATQKPVT